MRRIQATKEQSECDSRIAVTWLCSHGRDARTSVNQSGGDSAPKRMKACEWNPQRREQRAKFRFPQLIRRERAFPPICKQEAEIVLAIELPEDPRVRRNRLGCSRVFVLAPSLVAGV
jgi:hypothetical protein